jgi:hypothetical protein
VIRFIAGLLVCFPALAADPLPSLRAQPRNVTASGLSSGGYMAVQLHVAHSSIVSGVGVTAGGPYYCAQGSFWTAYYNCMTPSWWTPLPPVGKLSAETEALARAGRIVAPDNLRDARVWLFAGTKDRTVSPPVVQALGRFYETYRSKLVVIAHHPAGHAMVTADAGNKDCSVTAAPYLNDCDYDAAGESLKHLLGSLDAASTKPGGRLLAFDQTPYAKGAGMDDIGYLYLPKACDAGGCRVHVAFHGCRQNARAVGESFVRDAGYNRWADTNRLIVLYPQAASSWSPFAYNPRGCWDWWGYTDARYHTKEGAQIRAVKAMLDRLSS